MLIGTRGLNRRDSARRMMDLQMIAQAMGVSDGVLTFWDECPEIGLALPRPEQVVHEVRFGAGDLDGTPCLILYLFVGEDVLECYMEEILPTRPDQDVPVWTTLLEAAPDLIKIRYGAHPTDGSREVSLLLPAQSTECLADRLTTFARATLESREEAALAPVIQEFLQHVVEAPSHASRES